LKQKWITLLGGLLIIGLNQNCTKEESLSELQQKAEEIHNRVLTIDTHTDTPLRLLRRNFDLGIKHNPRETRSKIDIPRMIEGGLDAVFFAVFVGQGDRDSEGNEKAKEKALALFDKINETVKKHSDQIELAFTADDAYRIEKSGKRTIFIGMENGYPIGNDLVLLKKYHELGTRYITLCHTKNNDICDSSTDKKGPEHKGLSPFGEQVVEEMNRLGIMVDVSHISDEAFYDVLETSNAPVIASHSCARALCDNPRNLDDDMLKALADKGGVIQMCILSDYVKTPDPNPERDSARAVIRSKFDGFDKLSEDEQNKIRAEWDEINLKFPRKLATVSDVVDHIDHIVKVIGVDHVGIGTDFDGGGGVEDCYDVSEMGNITLELLKRGYSEEQIAKIWSGNLIRVLREVDRISQIKS